MKEEVSSGRSSGYYLEEYNCEWNSKSQPLAVCLPASLSVGLSRMLQCLLRCPFSRGTASACVTANLLSRHQALLSGCPVGTILGRTVGLRGEWENARFASRHLRCAHV